MEEPWVLGVSVRLHSIVATPELNGKEGMIVRFDKTKPDRAHVSFHSGDPKEAEVIKSIAKSKMQVLDAPEPPGSFDDLSRFLENFEYESKLASFVATKCCQYRGGGGTAPPGSEDWLRANHDLLERAKNEYLKPGKGRGPWRCRLCDTVVPLEELKVHLASVGHGGRLTSGPDAPKGFKKRSIPMNCSDCGRKVAWFGRGRVNLCWRCLLDNEHDLKTLRLDLDKLDDLGIMPCSRSGGVVSSSFNCRICDCQLRNADEVLTHCEGSSHGTRWVEAGFGSGGAFLKLFRDMHTYEREGG